MEIIKSRKNVIIYNRVSTIMQDKNESLTEQTDECIRYCNEKGYNIIKILKGLADDGKCIIMVTHDMNNLKNADIIYRLENKTLVRCDINDIKKCD